MPRRKVRKTIDDFIDEKPLWIPLGPEKKIFIDRLNAGRHDSFKLYTLAIDESLHIPYTQLSYISVLKKLKKTSVEYGHVFKHFRNIIVDNNLGSVITRIR